MTLTERKGTGN